MHILYEHFGIYSDVSERTIIQFTKLLVWLIIMMERHVCTVKIADCYGKQTHTQLNSWTSCPSAVVMLTLQYIMSWNFCTDLNNVQHDITFGNNSAWKTDPSKNWGCKSGMFAVGQRVGVAFTQLPSWWKRFPMLPKIPDWRVAEVAVFQSISHA